MRSVRSRPRRSPLALLCAAAASAVLGGCAGDPVSGSPELVLTSEAGEIRRGQEVAELLEQWLPFEEDPELVAYVERIGQRLVAHSPRSELEHHFRVVAVAEPNAFAVPGGHIYVTRGLLLLLRNEDELALTLAHEIAHVSARHSVDSRVHRASFLPVNILASLGGAAVGLLSRDLGRGVARLGQLPSALALAAFDRSQEREADRLGQEIAARAGWDPAGLAGTLDALERHALATLGESDLSYFASHPAFPERRAVALAHARSLARPQRVAAAEEPAAFLKRIEGLLVGSSASDGVFLRNRFLHPERGFAVTFTRGYRTGFFDGLVSAIHPRDVAYQVLLLGDEGDDPVAALAELASSRGQEVAPFEVAGLPAARLDFEVEGEPPTELTYACVAFEGHLYYLVHLALQGENRPEHVAGLLASFRPLDEDDRARIFEQRLRIVEAGAETLTELGNRFRTAWTPEESAVANRIDDPDLPLEPGRPVKMAVPVLYVPKPAPDPEPDDAGAGADSRAAP